MPSSCVVPGCKTGKSKLFLNQKISIFKVPKDDVLKRKWEEAIPGVDSLKNSQYVCERHFEDKFIVKRYIKHDNDGNIIADVPYQRPRLELNTVPTLFGDSAKSLTMENQTQKSSTPLPAADCTTTPIPSPTVNAVDVSVKKEKINVAKKVSSDNIQIITNLGRQSIRISSDSNQKENYRNNDIITSSFRQGESIPNMTYNECFLDHNYTLAVPQKPKAINFTSNFRIDNDNIVLPKSWGISEKNTKYGKQLIFTHVDIQTINDIDTVMLEKCVTINFWDGRIRYFVYGRQLLDHRYSERLPEIFKSNKMLLSLLAKFQKMHVCEGIGPIDSSLMKESDKVDNRMNMGYNYNHSQCPLLSNDKKCEHCRKLRKTILQRRKRSLQITPTPQRIATKLSLIDYQKLLFLKRKVYREQRKRLQDNTKVH